MCRGRLCRVHRRGVGLRLLPVEEPREDVSRLRLLGWLLICLALDLVWEHAVLANSVMVIGCDLDSHDVAHDVGGTGGIAAR